MSILLYPHNQIAYQAALHLMQEEGKAAIIHPTGTGKSFVAFKLAEEHPEKKICWLAPSEYIFRTQLENLGKNEENISFLTYSKLMMDEAVIETLHPDFIILDEFHRCGAAEWGKSVEKLLAAYPKAKILGLSATSVRYLDNQRDMAEELFDGAVASEMTLGEAIAKEILPAPTYIVSMYAYGEELKRLKKRVDSLPNAGLRSANAEILERLRRSLEQAEGLDQTFARHMEKDGKYIVFCSNKEHMEEMAERSKEWFGLVDRAPHFYFAYYDNPKAEKEFDAFKKDESGHLKLLFSIDMLNEGVHVADIDGVVLLRPTVSPILYLQQIGRALSVGSKKEPIIFDIVNNFDSLYCIDSLQKDMEEALFQMERTDGERQRFGGQFRIMDEMRESRKLFEELWKNLSASWELYYAAAASYYSENGNLNVPKKYVTAGGLTLGSWILTQRRIRAGKVAGTLSEEQIAKLDAVGMVWTSRSEQSFLRGYEALAEYRRTYGNADVKAGYITNDGYALGRWVANTRQRWSAMQEDAAGNAGDAEFIDTAGNVGDTTDITGVGNAARKSSARCGRSLTAEQIHMLDAIDMIWDKNLYQWNRNYEAAAEYFRTHGNLDVPCVYCTETGLALGNWIQSLKQIYAGKRSESAALTEEQIKKLDAIGMIWSTKNENIWEEKFTLARQYYEEHGNLNIPSGYCVGDVQLGKWIASVRLKRLNPASSGRKLTESRIRALDAIGMEWEKK